MPEVVLDLTSDPAVPDGAITTPQPGGWRGIDLRTSDNEPILRRVLLCYGGAGAPAIRLGSVLATIDRCTIEHFAGNGIDANGSSHLHHVTRNRITDCGGEAILKEGRFTRLDRGTVMDEIAEALAAPPDADTRARAELVEAVMPFVRDVYAGYALPQGAPHYRQSCGHWPGEAQ